MCFCAVSQHWQWHLSYLHSSSRPPLPALLHVGWQLPAPPLPQLVVPCLPLPCAKRETHCLRGATRCVWVWDNTNSASKQILVVPKGRGEIMEGPRENLGKKPEGKWRNTKRTAVAEGQNVGLICACIKPRWYVKNHGGRGCWNWI